MQGCLEFPPQKRLNCRIFLKPGTVFLIVLTLD